MPAKIRKVMAVPTAGMETKVGTKVPIIEPMVLAAFSLPTTVPLSSMLLTVYLTSEGVTVPSKKSGKTNTTMQAAKAAIIRKLLLIEKISATAMPVIIYFPSTGMAAIHMAAMMILP